jgi:uncharacterized membrane protein (DUF2068 family)
LVKGVLLIGLALGAFKYLRGDWQNTLIPLIERLNVDPGSRYFQAVVGKIVDIYPKYPKLSLLCFGTMLYGAIFCVEGVGLLNQKRWAEYVTLIVTASFLPLEFYELFRHLNALKAIVTILNIAIVVYLIIRLRKDRPARRAGSEEHRERPLSRSWKALLGYR